MDIREGRFFNSNDSHNLNDSCPMIILFNILSSSITNRFTFIKQSPSISSLSIPFKQSVSNTLKLWAYPYSNRFVVLLSYSSSIFSRYSLFCRMNRSRESASQLLAIHQSYLSRPILSLHRMQNPYEFPLQWVMECLSQIRLSISTLQYHFAYIRIAIISFD